MTAQIARGRRGVVSAGHGLASEAAITMLRAGGNAVDASIAAALVLAVVCPYAVSLAGDLYALVYEPKSGKVAGLNATGAAPAAAARARFADGIPGTGILSATVPGMLRGLDDLGRRFGTRPLAALLPPALRAGGRGFPCPSPARGEHTRSRRAAGEERSRARAFSAGRQAARRADAFSPARSCDRAARYRRRRRRELLSWRDRAAHRECGADGGRAFQRRGFRRASIAVAGADRGALLRP